MGREKLKVVIRCSWVLDYKGIEEPQIAKRRKGFEIIMQLEKARTENHNLYGSFWWCTRDHCHEHKWQKHCRVAFKYKNLYGEKTILCALCNWHGGFIFFFLNIPSNPIISFHLSREKDWPSLIGMSETSSTNMKSTKYRKTQIKTTHNKAR